MAAAARTFTVCTDWAVKGFFCSLYGYKSALGILLFPELDLCHVVWHEFLQSFRYPAKASDKSINYNQDVVCAGAPLPVMGGRSIAVVMH